ncbi:MAG: dienelactone hydrolase family protein [Alphaproteobacteria bacterium]|nr:dienelactone hydrolase family protein [Alphaproteobacteria bacterium]
MAEFITPSKAKNRGGVLVIHSWWGLTDSFRDYGRLLADQGFVVGLSDLFGGRTARTAEDAKRLRSAPRREPMYKSLIHDLIEVQDRAQPDAPLGVVGFSMGGHWAVWLSQRPDLPIASVVLYYAARGGDFSNSRASYLAHFAETDEWVSSASRRTMERQIKSAQRPYASIDYPGTGHWFAETAPTGSYRPEAAQVALKRTVRHFNSTLS